MMKKNIAEENHEETFELPVENELLMLKLQAEFGAECATGNQDIPPAVVNEFLKSVYEFEQKFREPCKQISVYDKVGRPSFAKAENLKEDQVTAVLKGLIRVLNSKGIQVDILGEYDHLIIYRFITEELFLLELDDIDMPGYTHHFCYEEFHPNHELDIRRHSTDFLEQWLARKIDEYSWSLAKQFVHPDTRLFSKEQVIKKAENIFAAYPLFSKHHYQISEVSFKWDPRTESGTGFSQGRMSYTAFTEANESVEFDGPFSFYFSNTDNWWSIYYFVIPGFSWNE